MTTSKVWSGIFSSVGQRDQRLAGELLGDPALRRLRTDAAIKLDRRRVPVEHIPLHVRALSRQGDACHVAEQGVADAATAMRRRDVDVLHEQAVLAGEGAKQEIPQCEADRGAVYFSQDGVDGGFGAEQDVVQRDFSDRETVL